MASSRHTLLGPSLMCSGYRSMASKWDALWERRLADGLLTHRRRGNRVYRRAPLSNISALGWRRSLPSTGWTFDLQPTPLPSPTAPRSPYFANGEFSCGQRLDFRAYPITKKRPEKKHPVTWEPPPVAARDYALTAEVTYGRRGQPRGFMAISPCLRFYLEMESTKKQGRPYSSARPTLSRQTEPRERLRSGRSCSKRFRLKGFPAHHRGYQWVLGGRCHGFSTTPASPVLRAPPP